MACKRSTYLIFSGCLAALTSVISAASAQSIDLLCVKTHEFGSPLLPEKVSLNLFREDKRVLIREGDSAKPEEYADHVETDSDTPKEDDKGAAVTTCRNVHRTFAKFDARYDSWGKEEISTRCGSVDDRSKDAVMAKDNFSPYFELSKRTGTLLYFRDIPKDKFDSRPADEVFRCQVEGQ